MDFSLTFTSRGVRTSEQVHSVPCSIGLVPCLLIKTTLQLFKRFCVMLCLVGGRTATPARFVK